MPSPSPARPTGSGSATLTGGRRPGITDSGPASGLAALGTRRAGHALAGRSGSSGFLAAIAALVIAALTGAALAGTAVGTTAPTATAPAPGTTGAFFALAPLVAAGLVVALIAAAHVRTGPVVTALVCADPGLAILGAAGRCGSTRGAPTLVGRSHGRRTTIVGAFHFRCSGAHNTGAPLPRS